MATLKIDAYESSFFPFGVYRLEPTGFWGKPKWRKLENFKTIEEAKVYMEQVKDLPIFSGGNVGE